MFNCHFLTVLGTGG